MSAAVAEQVALPPMTGPQVQILRIDERPETFWDVEGSPRSAKSWGVGFWIWKLAYQYPGIAIFYVRYKESNLPQLREVWGKVAAYFPPALHPQWNTRDGCYDFPNGVQHGEVYTGSRVFLSGIKPSDLDGLHAKYKGKTLAVIIVEEAQELPYANYEGMRERLSQSRTPMGEPYAYPLKLVLVHNCVDEDHWIAREYPLDDQGRCTRPNHAHIRADLHSNRQNLGAAVMALYEQNYPVGHPLRPTVIEGRRGVSLIGKPVYGGYFDRAVHVSRATAFSPFYPLLEGWDFGHEKPAVTWWQYLAHSGTLVCLGGVRGHEMFIETFAPKVVEIRNRLFPSAQVQAWCDPAGATTNFGTARTAVRLLQDLGIPVRYTQTANNADVRYAAIQVLAGYMERVGGDGLPAFRMHPQCIEVKRVRGEIVEEPSDLLVKSFEVGYVWDEHAPSDAHPNIRKPKKGTRYDDLMNASEYVVTGEGWSVPSQASFLTAAERLRIAQIKAAAEAYERELQSRAVGPTGETLVQAFGRIAAHNKAARDRDPLDRRPAQRRGRGGW